MTEFHVTHTNGWVSCQMDVLHISPKALSIQNIDYLIVVKCDIYLSFHLDNKNVKIMKKGTLHSMNVKLV